MRLEPPENVDGLSPREAWQAGVRAGQEGLAKSINASTEAAAAAERATEQRRLEEQIQDLRLKLQVRANEDADRASLMASVERRLRAVERRRR
jgi:hypothetical protein